MEQHNVLSASIEHIPAIVRVLVRGEVILYPTDTIYGIGCDATNEHAVAKVRAVKGRGETKPFIALVSDIEILERYAHMPQRVKDIVSDTQGYSISFVLDARDYLLRSMASTDGSVCFRIPNDIFCRALVEGLGKPIVATSANMSGVEYTEEALQEKGFWKERGISLFVHREGVSKIHEHTARPSTILDVRGEKVEVLREGDIPSALLQKYL